MEKKVLYKEEPINGDAKLVKLVRIMIIPQKVCVIF